MEEGTLAQAQAVLSESGQSVAEFLRAWLVSVAEEAHEEPNASTLAAFAEGERGEVQSFSSVADFLGSLDEKA